MSASCEYVLVKSPSLTTGYNLRFTTAAFLLKLYAPPEKVISHSCRYPSPRFRVDARFDELCVNCEMFPGEVPAASSTIFVPSGAIRLYLTSDGTTNAPSLKTGNVVSCDLPRSNNSGTLICGAYGVESLICKILVNVKASFLIFSNECLHTLHCITYRI